MVWILWYQTQRILKRLSRLSLVSVQNNLECVSCRYAVHATSGRAPRSMNCGRWFLFVCRSSRCGLVGIVSRLGISHRVGALNLFCGNARPGFFFFFRRWYSAAASELSGDEPR